jgi:ribonuclease BN (tRNA processing enzyme)
VLQAGAELEIVGPVQPEGSLGEALSSGLAPPLFPIGIDDMAGTFRFRELSAGCFTIGGARVTVFPVTHVGPTNGYRIETADASLAYISDFQQPADGSMTVSRPVAEACRGVDVLIHDAQYDAEEFSRKHDWGHCTVHYSVEVARTVGAARLVLYHHDPAHDDAWIDRAVDRARKAAGGDVEIVAAREGMSLQIR